jgi:hypothetical protein
MARFTQIERCILESGLIPELLRDGFRETNGEYIRDRGTVCQIVAFRRSPGNAAMFQIPLGLCYPVLDERYAPWFRLVHAEYPFRSMTVHRSTCLPEIDGAGDFDWWYDGKRNPGTMSKSIVHAWREYGRIWLDSRSALSECARGTLKERERVRAAIFYLAAGEREKAESALREEITFLQYRDDRRIRMIRKCAKAYGIPLPPPTDDLKWKRRNEAWESNEGWEACINPYHADQLLQRRNFEDDRLTRLIGIATAEQYTSHFTVEERNALREAREMANGVPHAITCPIELQFKLRGGVHGIRYHRSGRSIVARLPCPPHIVPWDLGPRFACEHANLTPEQITEITNHCSAAMHIIRDIIGNLFHSYLFDPAYRSEQVTTLAREIFDGFRSELCPILADVLEDAGFYESGILAHLRSNERHYAGCWAIDAILGLRETVPVPVKNQPDIYGGHISL